jgi:hypothetical protein
MTDPSKIEKYTAIASNWADYFLAVGDTRERLISAYVKRCQERRFWCTPVTSLGRGEVLCRLGHKMIYFDGRLLHVVNITPGEDREAVFGVQLKPNEPTTAHARMLAMKAKKYVKQQGLPPISKFDSLTTFSKPYRDLISHELDLDLGGTTALYPDIETRSMRFIRPKRRFYNATGAVRLKELASHLNPDILRTIRGVGCPSMSLYNWIAAGDATRRIQAVRAYPLLMPLLILCAEKFYLDGGEEPIRDWKDPDNEFYNIFDMDNPEPRITSRAAEAIGKQVDAGEQLLPIVAKAFKVPEAVIKQVAKHPVHHTGSALRHIGRESFTMEIETYAYAAMLGNRKPTTKKAWQHWLLFYRNTPSHVIYSIAQEDRAAFLAGMPDFDDARWEVLTQKCKDLSDLPLQRLGLCGMRGWTLARLLNLSEKWHEERARCIQQMNKDDERNASPVDPGWHPLLTTPFYSNGLTIIELNTPDQLNEEARRLSHCVDGYSAFCYDGRSRILSIRDDKNSIATMEICLKPYKKAPGVSHLYCAQLRGYANKGFEDNSPVLAIAKKLLSHIRGGRVEVNLEWPYVPVMQRPLRMRRHSARINEHMTLWLQAELGVTLQQQIAPAA